MSEIADRDNNVPESQNINGSFNNGSTTKAQTEGTEEKQSEGVSAVVDTSIKIDKTETPAAVEVEYIETEDLKDVEDEDFYTVRRTLLSKLSSRNWVSVCNGLNNVRRLCIFRKEALVNMRDEIFFLVVRAIMSRRSAVCKTGLMTAADLFKEYKDDIVGALDPMLSQVLTRASHEKKFLREAAESALIALTSWISPTLLLPKLPVFLTMVNPHHRAKATMCLSRIVSRMGADEIEAFGIDKLLKMSASRLVNDRLSVTKNAARDVLLVLKAAYEKSHVPELTAEPEQPVPTSWEGFCESELPPLTAEAVLRVTNPAR